MLKQIKCTVIGRVQGVLFRNFTRLEAKRLGLVGKVWNESDGSVRVVAEGEEGKLKEFIEKLETGTPWSSVKSVSVEWRDITKLTFSDFTKIW